MNSTSQLNSKQLSGHLQQHCKAKTKSLYVMVDGTGGSVLMDFFREAPAVEYRPVFHGTEFEACLPASPYLAEIKQESVLFLTQSGVITWNETLWFTSACDLDTLTHFWRNLVTALLPNGKTVLFRAWNGFVLNRYLTLLSAKERQHLLHPIEDIYTPDAIENIWHHHTVQSATPSLNLAESAKWQIKSNHLVVFQSTFEQILAQHIHDQLWSLFPTVIGKLDPTYGKNYISQGITRARGLGLSTDRSLVTFVKLQLQLGDHFWQHPDWSVIWSSTNNKDREFLWQANVATSDDPLNLTS